MPASLGALPPEIINQIISNIEKSGWLLDLALACRSLYKLTVPYLYSDVKLIYHRHETRFPYLRSFSIHVLNHPGLASHVRSFTLGECWGTSSDPSKAEDSDSVDDAVRAVVRKISQCSEEEEVWIDDLKTGGDEDAYLCLLLPSLPNLERMDLFVPENPEVSIFKIIMDRILSREKPFDLEPAFSSLRVIVNNCSADKYGEPPDLISSFLKLPSLQEYYCLRIGSGNRMINEGLTQLKTASSSLTHLEVRECKFNARDLRNLLRAMQNLRTFVYELGWSYVSSCDYSTPGLRRALAWTEASLENLWLDYLPGPSYWTGDFLDDHSPMFSLSSFECLKNIKVGMYVFFGVVDVYSSGLENTEVDIGDGNNIINLANILPASAETLYVSHTNGRIRLLTQALERLLEQKGSSTPRLMRIAFEAYITGNDEKFDFSRLDPLGEEANVRIDRIDGTALPANNGVGWECSSGVHDRGQGMDGSLKWAAEVAIVRKSGVPVYINAGK